MSAPVRVEKQDIHIVVDPQTQKISGYTEIEFSAMTRSPPPVLFLNARQMNVTAVSIDGQPAKYTFIDSHRALDFNQQRDGRYARDATYFAAICQVVLESPDLVIELGGAKFPVVVRVDFDVHEDSTAIMRENDTILTDNWANGPSSWFPCVDTRAQRSTFTLWVTYSEEFVAIGPGESLHRKDAHTRMDTMMFRIPFPVAPSAVGFCLGRFSSEPLENSNPNGSTGVMYFLDNRDTFNSTMKAMPDIMNAAMELFDYDDVPVFPRMHFVSVPFLPDLRVFPSVCLIPPHMMLPEGNVNVVPTVVPLLVEAIVSQYILFLFPVADPTREWWQTGFVLYFSDVIVSKFYSRSWFLDRRWNDINFLYEEDIHPSFVLRAIDPTTGEPYHDPYLRIKAKLLVTMIAQSMQSRSDKQLTVNLINALKYSESESNFGSDDFLEDIFKFCPSIIEEKFNQQWLSRSGMPVFTYNYKKDTRGKTVKVVLFQQSSVSGTTKRRKDSDQKKDDPDVFTGKMVIQLLDMQQPIESYVQIEKQLHQFQLQFYAKKYKKRKVNFKFQDGTSMDVGAYDPVIWIILDPKPTWICRIRGKLPEYMLEYQLKLRRDAFAQHEVIGEMEDFCQTENSLKSLEDLISNPEYWWGVRCHAARAMARFNSDGNSSTHMQKLIEWYKRNFYEASNVPKPHDFHDVPTHYVQLEVIKSLSIIREGNNVTPSVLIDMFLQIAGSSNTRNMYNDDAFTAEVELALGRVIFTDQIKFTRAWEDVESKINLYSANTRLEGAVVAAAGYEALTGMTLKCCTRDNSGHSS